jgi:hypothetical protein
MRVRLYSGVFGWTVEINPWSDEGRLVLTMPERFRLVRYGHDDIKVPVAPLPGDVDAVGHSHFELGANEGEEGFRYEAQDAGVTAVFLLFKDFGVLGSRYLFRGRVEGGGFLCDTVLPCPPRLGGEGAPRFERPEVL